MLGAHVLQYVWISLGPETIILRILGFNLKQQIVCILVGNVVREALMDHGRNFLKRPNMSFVLGYNLVGNLI